MNQTPQPGSNERYSVSIARAILRTRVYRRNLMFWLTLALLGATALGAFVLMESMVEAPLFFLLYWGFVGFLLFFLLMLALYDLLSVGREIRAEARAAEAREAQRDLSDLDVQPEPFPDETDPPGEDDSRV